MSRIIVKNVTSGRELLWRHIKIKKSLDDICHTLELEIPAGEYAKVNKHDRITVRYVNSIVREPHGQVTTVLVDEITSSADVSKHNILVIGRSPARDIIDSTWSGFLINNPNAREPLTLFKITEEIAGKFGIGCINIPTNRGDPTKTVYSFIWNDESPWTKLVAEADSQGFIITSNQDGNLYIWRPEGAVREAEKFFLAEGRNIKTIEWKSNGAGQYHEYILTGGIGDPVSVFDDTCNNSRVLTIPLTNPTVWNTDCLYRAEIEKRRRKEDRVTATVSGWGLTDAQIQRNLGTALGGKEIFWTPNLLIPVSMPSLGFRANLLIAEVEQEAGVDTMSSAITLVKREAYLCPD
jgi:prophage tail gpP-like protein